MRELEVAMTLIEQQEGYILQVRDSSPEKGAAGMIGLFGGQLEEGESWQEAALRELREETTLDPSIDELERLGKIEVISDRNNESVRIKANIFHLFLAKDVKVIAKEGGVVVMSRYQAATNLHKMTPGTRASFREFVFEEE